MTEDEAKETVCPLMSHQGSLGFIEQKCRGRRCMWWREVYIDVFDGTEYNPKGPVGFCGVAGHDGVPAITDQRLKDTYAARERSMREMLGQERKQ